MTSLPNIFTSATFPFLSLARFPSFILLLSATIVTQWANGAFLNEFAIHSDEAAHFVTGLFFHDLLRPKNWSAPIRFAGQFYIHYPKVAIGHWGPTFYLLQGIWGYLFGTSRTAVLLLMGVITTSLAFLLYQLGRRSTSTCFALSCALALIFTPAFQRYSASVMSEPLSSLLVFCAAICWGYFLDRGDLRYSISFGVFASLAILTKGNGLLLAFVPPISIILLKKYHYLIDFRFWLPAIIVSASCGPWLALTLNMQRNGMQFESFSITYVRIAAPFYLTGMLHITGVAILSFGLIGIVIRRTARAERAGSWAAMVSLITAALVFHVLVPAGCETRHLSLLIAPILLFASIGMYWTAQRIARLGLPRGFSTSLVALAAFLLFFVETGWGHVRPWRGFSAVVDALDEILSNPGCGFLVSSDELGDGMFIADVAMRDNRPNRYALRASKALASSRWDGRNYRVRFGSAEEVAKWLERTRIGVLVLDNSVDHGSRPEHAQLLDVVRMYPARWESLGEYDVIRNGNKAARGIAVFRQNGLDSYRVRDLEINMGEMLGKAIRQEGG